MLRLLPILAALLAFAPSAALPQSPPPQAPAPAASLRCLVVPFTNRSSDPSLDWIGESYVISLRAALTPASPALPICAVLSRADRGRDRALIGAPPAVALSHASMLRLAKAADARWLVLGWFDYDGDTLTAGAEVVDLLHEHLVRLQAPGGPLDSLQQLQSQLAWAVRRRLDPLAPGTPPLPTSALPLSAYEDFVRAQLASTPAAQIKFLQVAAQLAPHDSRVLFALGQACYDAQQDQDAVQALAQIPASDPQYLHALFTTGLAQYRLGHFGQAAAAWQQVARTLPLPAVTNNLKVALAAQAHATDPGAIETAFPAEGFEQLASVVASVEASRVASLSPQQRVQFQLQAGERLRRQGGLEAAAAAFQRVLDGTPPAPPAARAAAHAGLAAIWYARHDDPQASKEVAAALAADPSNAQALAIQRQLAQPHP